jgi:hypothetical protein
MIKIASRLFFPFLLMSVFASAACSSSGGTSPGNDGGTPVGSPIGSCPEHCTYDSTRDSACTSSSHVGARFGCACDRVTFTGFDDGFDCASDLDEIGTGKNGLCCNPKLVRQPAGSACDTAADCEQVTCTCGDRQGGKSSGCENGVCAGAKELCGC